MKNVFLIISISLFLSACVSVNLNTGDYKKAENIDFSSPSSPFKEFEQNHLDKAWYNESNGNSISFLSDCSSSSDPSLRTIQQGITRGILKLKITKEESLTYNGRRALSTQTSGEVDGITTLSEILIFKKNGCIYVLTYAGLKNSFNDDYPHFKKFISRFKAP